jgi:hypothetical protein
MVKSNAPQSFVKASKAAALTNELMNKAVHNNAAEIVAAKPGLDGHTPKGFAEKLVKEGKEISLNLL